MMHLLYFTWTSLCVYILSLHICECLVLPSQSDIALPDPKHEVNIAIEKDGQCSCHGYTCSCCLKISIPEFHINDQACTSVTYLVHDYGIRVIVSWDGKNIIDASVSARNPPPLCVGIPDLEKVASVCLEFYDLDVSNKTFSGCVMFLLRIIYVKAEKVKLGCFTIPPEGLETSDSKANVTRSLEKKSSKSQEKTIKEWSTEEKTEFLRRLGLLGKEFHDGKLNNIIVGYN